MTATYRPVWVHAVLLAFVIGFALFPPRLLLIVDELHYVTQAVAFSSGSRTIAGADPLVPANPLRVASNYPPGTSLLQAPLVWVAGWKAAAALSALALIVMTLVTMRWLRENEMNAEFAVLIPGFFAALFFGRVAMSDIPSAAVVAVSLWLLWRADRGWVWSFCAGLAGGLNFIFRELSVVLLAPVFVGAVARKKCVPWALILGGVAGIAVRLALSEALFGSALYVRDPGYGFSLSNSIRNAPLYAAILLIMFPLGGLLPFLYRGPRRAELVLGISLYVGMLLLYDYGGVHESGRARGLILVARYLIPALPIFALMAADVFPRLLRSLPPRVQRLALTLSPAFFVLIGALAFGVHPLIRRQEREPLSVVTAIQRSAPEGIPVVTNHHATLKYLSPIYGIHPLILRSYISAADIPAFYQTHKRLTVIFLDRDDSAMFREDAKQNGVFLSSLQGRCSWRVVHDAMHGPGARLRVLSITGCD
jgi:hypothetical protein